MLSQSTWRNQARPIIARVLEQTRGLSEPEIKAALHDAYPFGERKYHPYKIWLNEIKAQRDQTWAAGHKQLWNNRKKREREQAAKLQEWEAIYGRRIA